MATPETTPAFVLRKVDYRDKDIIATLLGRDTGKFSAIAYSARASRKRFGGGLQPMRQLSATFSRKPNRDLATLQEIEVIDDFAALETDFERIAIGSYATELVREVTQADQSEPAIFDLLSQTYHDLAGAPADVLALEVVLHHFELRLLEFQGALPSLGACFRCGASPADMDKLRCMRTGEGLVCRACRRPGESVGVLGEATLALLDYLGHPGPAAPDGLANPDAVAQARRVIDTSFEYLLDNPLNSRPMLEAVLDRQI